VSAEALRGGGGTIRAYDLVSNHHALGACRIICFEKRFEQSLEYPTKIKLSQFWKRIASGLHPSALVSAKKFQGVLNSAKRITAR